FSFEPYDAWQLFGTVVRAVETHRHVATWTRLVQRAMREDVSWARSAVQYAALYRSALAGRRGRRGGPVGIARPRSRGAAPAPVAPLPSREGLGEGECLIPAPAPVPPSPRGRGWGRGSA